MLKSLLILQLILLFSPLLQADEPTTFAPEDEWLITDRDRGSREKQNLYDYNRQNVQYNRRYDSSRNDYNTQSDYYYNQPSSMDTFNRSNYQDNTSPGFYLNR